MWRNASSGSPDRWRPLQAQSQTTPRSLSNHVAPRQWWVWRRTVKGRSPPGAPMLSGPAVAARRSRRNALTIPWRWAISAKGASGACLRSSIRQRRVTRSSWPATKTNDRRCDLSCADTQARVSQGCALAAVLALGLGLLLGVATADLGQGFRVPALDHIREPLVVLGEVAAVRAEESGGSQSGKFDDRMIPTVPSRVEEAGSSVQRLGKSFVHHVRGLNASRVA